MSNELEDMKNRKTNNQQISWNSIRQQEWFRYVIINYALVRGLCWGIGIPLINSIPPTSPDFNLLKKLFISVPFFVIVWSIGGAYLWNKMAKEKRCNGIKQRRKKRRNNVASGSSHLK